ARAPYVMLVVPLLLETGSYRDIVQRILVVDCEETTQVKRTMARSNLTEQEVRAIMAAQLPRAERLARADDVITNEGDMAALREQVRELHEQYFALSKDAIPRQ
ncbi:MAG TPA: dephospho-CoA kinase, partial [Burkholderiales bacterium]